MATMKRGEAWRRARGVMSEPALLIPALMVGLAPLSSAQAQAPLPEVDRFVAAKVLAATGADLLTRPQLLVEARSFFQEATGGRPYQSPIPADQPPPVP